MKKIAFGVFGLIVSSFALGATSICQITATCTHGTATCTATSVESSDGSRTGTCTDAGTAYRCTDSWRPRTQYVCCTADGGSLVTNDEAEFKAKCRTH